MNEYFNASSIKRLIYIILITCVAFFIYYKYQNSQTYWLVWSILIASLITTGDTFKERLATLCLTGIASAIVVMPIYYLTKLPIPLAFFFLLITLICVFLGEKQHKLFFPAFCVNLLAILAISYSASRIEHLERLGFILTGFLIAGLIQIFFSFHWVKSDIKSLTYSSLLNLKLLSKEIFACFLNIEYKDNVYLFERRLHMDKNKFFQSNEKLQKLVTIAANKSLSEVTLKIEEIFDLLMACAQLRRRVLDPTTFDVCKLELQVLEDSVNDTLSALAQKIYRKNNLDLIKLDAAIDRFEEIYQSVLQVITKEPLIFFLFIESLKALAKTFAELNQLLDYFANTSSKSL